MQSHSSQEPSHEGKAPVDGSSAIRSVTDTYSDFAVWLYSKIRFLILRQPFLDEIGQYLPHGGRILDFGCTVGNIMLPYAEAFPGAEIHAVDVSAPL